MPWLHKLLADYRIPTDPYLELAKAILKGPLDPADKCEALLELFEPKFGAKRAEGVVREALSLWEKHGDASLDEEEPVGLSGPVALPKTPSKKPLNVNAPVFSFDSSPTPAQSPRYTEPARVDSMEEEDLADADEAYLDYEEDEGYNALSPEEILQSVFMDLPIDEIRALLEANGWNVERTLEAILRPPQPTNMAPYGAGTLTDSALMEPGRQVCRHFLAGECLRSDCWFSHDPEALICKFWLAGGCIKGSTCPFQHGTTIGSVARVETAYVAPLLAQKAPASPKARQVSVDEEFPALGAAKPAARPKLDFWSPTQKFVDVAKKVPTTPRHALGAATFAPTTNIPRRSTKLVDAKWVATGDTLAASYARHRQDAIDAAIQRNKLFQRATEAYLAGNKAAAKAFSLGAHRLNERVQELHRHAGQKIFESRNSGPSSGASADSTIDLHGLHPTEAVEMLETSIAKLRRESFTGRLLIVTGAGHHSRGQKAKLLPAIRDYLYKSGLRAQEASMKDGKGGMFFLQI
ncbi:hypothetical protein HDU87_008229 [Geranomyces variabilis]|uniref:Uncharacterized protein n=1 Tax=Geranomyces variabilis TaxID=109894 RepID=A0AAD5TES2_9FUNG|nr:hypothetical protein HDU87_008229 [Geranomyces variabilis]